MVCESELVYSIYADGELDPEATRRVESHLARCESCRRLVAGLREESATIARVLRLPEPAKGVVRRPAAIAPSHLAWILAAVAVSALGMHAFFAELSQLRLPFALRWLDPTNPWLHLSLIPRVLVGFPQGGVAMFFQSVSIASIVIFALGCGRVLRRRPAVMLAGVIVLAFMLPSAASATVTRFPKSANGIAIVPADETIDDTLFIAGETAFIDGNVKGDVIAAGERIRVTGAVGGSLICAAKELDVDGEVTGDIYSLTEFLSLRGEVRRNVHSMAKRVGIASGSSVARDIYVFTDGAKIEGRVDGDARVFGRWVEVPGRVGRNLRFKGERILIAATGYVGGDVTADVKDKRTVAIETADATEERGVRGRVEINEKRPRFSTSRYAHSRFYVWQLVRLVAACLTGAVLFWLAPGLFMPKPQSGASLLRSSGVGFVTLIAVPLAALLSGMTLIGLPMALLALAAWLATMYMASIFVAALVGRSLLRSGDGNGRSFLLALLLGLLILRVAVNLPWAGAIIGFLVLVVGMGMAVFQAAGVMRRVRASE
ncbi:MAG: zf-HC2 domain-containing protein [Vicinamibacteria bacterium]|nr:zf-HC2 domain-containing protein [Vicinamibacteria bacterium]